MAKEDLSRLKIDKSQQGFQPKKSRMRRNVIIILVVLVLIIAAGVSGVFVPSIKVETTSVVRLYPSSAFTLLNASGYVVPQRKAAVAAKVTGRLDALFVEEGSRIKAGQIIARLENEDLIASRKQSLANVDVALASLEQAKAELNDARVSFEREKQLLEREFTSRSSYDVAEARQKKAAAAVESASASVRAAQAALKGVDVSLGYTMIRAPFDAVVLTKNADVGDIVTPLGAAANAKSAVVTIADMASLQVEADVSESNIEKLRIGRPCEVQLDAIPDARFPASVYMIVPTADRSKATVMVKVRFQKLDSRVLPDMSAKVAFLSRETAQNEQTPRVAVNPRTIVSEGNRKYLFLVREGRVLKTTVNTGAALGDMVEIISGASPGDKAVLNPPKRLKNNTAVKIAEK